MKRLILLLIVFCTQLVFSNSPTDITISESDNNIIISWSYSTSADMYYIYRSTYTYSGFVRINGTPATFYIDIGDCNEIMYYYYVTAETGVSNDFEWCDISAGDYTYGNPPQTLNIDYYYQIMKYQVTNQQYVDYLEEALNAGDITVTTSTVQGYYTGDEHWSAGNYEFLDLDDNNCRIDWTGSEFTIVSGYEDHPATDVTWFGSWAFAEHYGLSLPTEQEWEKAARENTGYTYPWGNTIDGSRANYYNSGDPFDNGTTPIGYYNGENHSGFQTTDSPSPFGVYDMAGNVWDWTNNFWSDTSPDRVIRGGSWLNGTSSMRTWGRNYNVPTFGGSHTGFRCIRP